MSVAARTARLDRGLTQAQVAHDAGVSRALVAAVEQGRHVPAADAAVRIARALGTTVEELFAPEQPQAPVIAVLGETPADGAPVRAGRVGDAIVAAPLDPGAALWAAPDGVVEAGAVRLFTATPPGGLVVAGCDPALGIAAALLGPQRLVAVPATSGQALAALEAGRCHAALVHGPRLRPRRGIGRWRFARWRAGVAYDPSLGAPSLEALLADVTLVRRPGSAASQQAVERAARRLGLSDLDGGPVAASHVDAARRARWDGCAAVTIEPVAAHVGLGFHELEEHRVEVWVADRWREHPGLAALVDLLGRPAFRDRLASLPGYDLIDSGAEA
jgi:transcriptional regulator with XRE-family HTH domain